MSTVRPLEVSSLKGVGFVLEYRVKIRKKPSLPSSYLFSFQKPKKTYRTPYPCQKLVFSPPSQSQLENLKRVVNILSNPSPTTNRVC